MSILAQFFAGLSATAAVPAPPLPNPHDGGLHWYHGTHEEFEPEPTGHSSDDPGGRVRAPDRTSYWGGEHAEKHWNTDLGSHFAANRSLAEPFATGGFGATEGSRVAHVSLHMKNPKHYESEFDMSREAIGWAHANGHHYLSEGARYDGEIDEKASDGKLTIGHLVDHEKHGEEHEARLMHVSDHLSDHETGPLLHMDVHGAGHNSPGKVMDHYLALHPERDEITSGFKAHLQAQGHDGVTYGNEYESGKHNGREHGDHCAIAFDDDQVHIKKWHWMHPSQEHLNQAQPEPEKHGPSEHDTPMLSHSPEGWVDHDGKKVSRFMQAFLSVFEASKDEEIDCTRCGGTGNTHYWATGKGCEAGCSQGKVKNPDREAMSTIGEEQRALYTKPFMHPVNPEHYEQSHQRFNDFARAAQPGTRVWRGELRRKDEPIHTPGASTGVHWTTDPGMVLHPSIDEHQRETHEFVVHQARIDEDAQTVPASHASWSGRTAPGAPEHETRFKPGSQVHIEHTYTYDPHQAPAGWNGATAWRPNSHPDPITGSVPAGWSRRDVRQSVTVEDGGKIHSENPLPRATTPVTCPEPGCGQPLARTQGKAPMHVNCPSGHSYQRMVVTPEHDKDVRFRLHPTGGGATQESVLDGLPRHVDHDGQQMLHRQTA